MTAAITRQEFSARLTDSARFSRFSPEISEEAALLAAGGRLRDAAVLVPVVWHEAAPSILLTVRASTLSAHAGQVSFPGGRIEMGETAEAAALREAAEEVGLDPRLPRIAGQLPEHLTGTGFRVTPIVAYLDPPLTLTPDPVEVAQIFELPLATLLDPSAPERRTMEIRGVRRDFWVWPHPEHMIWGATAKMLVTLAELLRE